MIIKYVAAFLFVLIFMSSAFALESTEQLANRLLEGQKAFEALKQQRLVKHNSIMNDGTRTPKAQQRAIRNLQEEFLKDSRKIHMKYREPFVQRVIAETNAKLPEGQKIKKGLGSDIYLRNATTGKVIKDARGRSVLNPNHRGWQGDLDLGGNPRAVEELNKSFNKHRVNLSSNTMNAPGYKDYKGVEVTINVEGRMDKPGSSTHLTQTQMDAFSKETYVSIGMKENQAGKKLVETNDHIKKTVKGLNSPPANLVSAAGEDALQGMSKGTLKSIESGGVGHVQLNKILDEAGYEGGANKFRNKLRDLKGGHLAPGVGLNEKNAKAFQAACKKTTEQAVENASKAAAQEINNKKIRIAELEKMAGAADTPDDLKKSYRDLASYHQEQLADSKIKIEQTALANQEKLKGGNYDTFYDKNSGKTGKSPSKIIRKPTSPKVSRVGAIKKGLKPDVLGVVGYGASAYSIWDTNQKRKKGEISENEAIIEITGEVVDTGFGVVADVGTASAVTGAAATGSVGVVAAMAAPMIVTAVATHYVTEATKEGLKLVSALKNEEIAGKIADAKIQEAVNTFKIKVNDLMKQGVETGDWRYFASAEDIIAKLENMYTVTKDENIYQATNALFDQVDGVKGFLEGQYGTSIYGVKAKMEGNQEEAPQEAKAPKSGSAEESSGQMSEQVPPGDLVPDQEGDVVFEDVLQNGTEDSWGESQGEDIIFEDVAPMAIIAAQQKIDDDKVNDDYANHGNIATKQAGFNAEHQDYLAGEQAQRAAYNSLAGDLTALQQQILRADQPSQNSQPQPAASYPKPGNPYPAGNYPKPAWMTGGNTGQSAPAPAGGNDGWTGGFSQSSAQDISEAPCSFFAQKNYKWLFQTENGTGDYALYYDMAQTQMKIRGKVINCVREGKESYWGETGELKVEGNWLNGKRYGLQKVYFSNGQLNGINMLPIAGGKASWTKSFYSNGALKKECKRLSSGKMECKEYSE